MRRLLAGGVLALTVGMTAVAGADPSPTPVAEGPEAPLQVVVQQLLPRAPQAHGAVEVSGIIKNLGTTRIESIVVRLKVGAGLTTRGELHEADTDRPQTTRRTPNVAPTKTELLAGGAARFTIRTTVDVLGLRRLGVYPLDVEARGDAGHGPESLGLAPTWIPYFPDAVKPLRVAVVWPLVDQPRQGVDGALHDDALAASLRTDGRLGGMLAAARSGETRDCARGAAGPKGVADPAETRCEPVPVTYAVDPDLVSAAGTMTKAYKVAGKEGAGTAAATAWLTSLQGAVAGGSLLALPFADPDVSALSRTSGGQDDLALATVLGRTTLTQALHVAPLEAIAWPPAGTVSKAGADALARTGVRQLVLDESAYSQPDNDPDHVPNARGVFTTSALGDEIDGLVNDSTLSELLTGPDAGALGPRLAEQRFLAETAVIAAERPGRQRSLLLAPSRYAGASVPAAGAALRDLGRVPWLCPVTLAAVATASEHCSLRPTDPGTETEQRGDPRTDLSGSLSASFLSGIGRDRDVLSQLTSAVLSDSQDSAIRDEVAKTKERLRKAVARAESSAWRSDPQAGRESARLLHAEVTRLRDKVVVRGGKALLTSSKGTLQVSIENTLDVPVSVRVRFSSKTATLSAATTGLVSVPPGNAVQAGVKAEAQRSGQFVVFAQIIDRNGKPFGPEAEVIVRSTRFGRLALAVTAAGAGVLLVAAGVRVFRRAVSSR